MKKRRGSVIDLTQVAFITFGVGPRKGNPRLCLQCRKSIRRGEPWKKYTSATDQKLGRYSTIQHVQCKRK